MHDDLPEVFEQLKPPAAPAHLRSRVLAAVNSELAKRRKPRWERVLELSVAALLFIGVGLNAWQAYTPSSPWYSVPAGTPILAHGSATSSKSQVRAAHSLFDHRYARLLVELSENPAG
jgi:hypothetical protein